MVAGALALLVLLVQQVWLGAEHPRHADQREEEEEHLHASLAGVELRFGVDDAWLEEHVDDHIEQAWRRVVERVAGGVGGVPVDAPLVHDRDHKIAEERLEEEELWQELGPDPRRALKVQVVRHVEQDRKRHVHDTKHDRELHLERVGEHEVVLGAVPHGINARKVHGARRLGHKRALAARPCPAAPEEERAAAKDIVVHEAGEYGKEAHQQDDVAAVEEHLRDLVQARARELALEPDHGAGREGHEHAVAHVAKHDGEEEGEGDDRVQARVRLLVRRDAVCVHDRLEALGELVRALVRRRRLLGAHRLHHRGHVRAGQVGGAAERELYAAELGRRRPCLGDHGLLARVIVAHVHRRVYALLAKDEVVPRRDRLGDLEELGAACGVGAVQDVFVVFDAFQHLVQTRVALRHIALDWVERAAHAFANLADLGEHRRAVGKDDKHVLEDGLVRDRRVAKVVLDLGIVHVQIAAERAPQDTLERRHVRAVDGARDELEVDRCAGGGHVAYARSATRLAREQRCICVLLEAHAHLRLLRRRLGVLKKHGRLADDVLGLLELLETLLQAIVAAVHLRDALLVLLQVARELFHDLAAARLLVAVRRKEGDGALERARRDSLALKLRLQKLHAAVHLVEPPDVSDKRALEGRHVRIELRQSLARCGTHVFELHVAELGEFCHGRMNALRRDVQLDQRHRRGAEQALVAHLAVGRRRAPPGRGDGPCARPSHVRRVDPTSTHPLMRVAAAALLATVVTAWPFSQKRFKEAGFVEAGALGLDDVEGQVVAWGYLNDDRLCVWG